MTQSGISAVGIVATQNDCGIPIPPAVKPCCNRVLFGVVPALVKAMRRRDFIKVIAGSAAGWPLTAHAQQQERVRRVGVLMNAVENKPQGQARVAAFRQVLQQLGWSDGGNVRIDVRWGQNDIDRERKYAAEFGDKFVFNLRLQDASMPQAVQT